MDIASKLATEDGYEAHPFADSQSFTQLLWPLSNAGSTTIRRRLRSTRFFVRFSNKDEFEGNRRVIMTLQDNGMRLNKKQYHTDLMYGDNAYRAEPIEEDIRTVPYAVLSPEMSQRYI
jgi:hypothetical protein